MAYPTTGTPSDTPPSPDKVLSGSAAEVAAGLRAYADMGVAHVICSLDTTTPDAVAWLAEAVQIARQSL